MKPLMFCVVLSKKKVAGNAPNHRVRVKQTFHLATRTACILSKIGRLFFIFYLFFSGSARDLYAWNLFVCFPGLLALPRPSSQVLQ